MIYIYLSHPVDIERKKEMKNNLPVAFSITALNIRRSNHVLKS